MPVAVAVGADSNGDEMLDVKPLVDVQLYDIAPGELDVSCTLPGSQTLIGALIVIGATGTTLIWLAPLIVQLTVPIDHSAVTLYNPELAGIIFGILVDEPVAV